MRNEIKNGDAFSLFPRYERNSFSAVITSPPYNMNLRIRNGKYCSRQIVKEISTKYKAYDDNLPMEDYFQFLKRTVTESLRVAPYLFLNVQVLTGNKPAVFRLLGEFAYSVKELIVWNKTTAEPAIGAGVLNSQFELIIVFSKDRPESRRFAGAIFDRGTLSNLWDIKRGRKTHKEHGAIFPEALVERILTNFVPVGARVLDPFAGTGTVGAVSKRLGFSSIGFELDEDYAEAARQRIRNTRP